MGVTLRRRPRGFSANERLTNLLPCPEYFSGSTVIRQRAAAAAGDRLGNVYAKIHSPGNFIFARLPVRQYTRRLAICRGRDRTLREQANRSSSELRRRDPAPGATRGRQLHVRRVSIRRLRTPAPRCRTPTPPAPSPPGCPLKGEATAGGAEACLPGNRRATGQPQFSACPRHLGNRATGYGGSSTLRAEINVV